VVIVFSAWLAGPTRWAVAARAAMAPYVRKPVVAYAVLVVVVVLLLWWGPTPATRNPALALVLIVLMAIGTEVLRRQIVCEYPEARRGDTMRRVRGAVGAGAQRSLTLARQGAASGRAAVAGTTARVTAYSGGGGTTTPTTARLDELEQLGRLRQAGVLDEAEFRAQKATILAEPGPQEAPEPDGEGTVTPRSGA